MPGSFALRSGMLGRMDRLRGMDPPFPAMRDLRWGGGFWHVLVNGAIIEKKAGQIGYGLSVAHAILFLHIFQVFKAIAHI